MRPLDLILAVYSAVRNYGDVLKLEKLFQKPKSPTFHVVLARNNPMAKILLIVFPKKMDVFYSLNQKNYPASVYEE